MSRRLPAEWEEQSAVQFTFPHPDSDWGPYFEDILPCFEACILAVAAFQKVIVVCQDEKQTRLYFSSPIPENVHFFEVESNDTWARDHGGITVFEGGQPIILDFEFNGWGQKFEAGKDNQITSGLYKKGTFGDSALEKIPFVLEGGSIESDGQGTILTTSQCLLSKYRNPAYAKTDIEQFLFRQFGAKRLLWLNSGYLEGDDTDAHIDTLARFCNPNTIAYVFCENEADLHYAPLKAMEAELQAFIDPNGQPYQLVGLPLPEAQYDSEGNRLPATYANFLIINSAVIVPLYGAKEDDLAMEKLKEVFQDRKVIGVNCRPLIEQHGSLHCITMQYPKGVVK